MATWTPNVSWKRGNGSGARRPPASRGGGEPELRPAHPSGWRSAQESQGGYMSSAQGWDKSTAAPTVPTNVGAMGKEILPALALAQFLASYANTSLNVSISNITQDLG